MNSLYLNLIFSKSRAGFKFLHGCFVTDCDMTQSSSSSSAMNGLHPIRGLLTGLRNAS